MPRFETLDSLPALNEQAPGTRVLVRGDLNVPLADGLVADPTRIKRLAPTIIELANRGCKVIVMSHFDRPEGRVIQRMSLKPLLAPLMEALGGLRVVFVENCIGESAETSVKALPEGGIALLENLRFHAGEEENDEKLLDAMVSGMEQTSRSLKKV